MEYINIPTQIILTPETNAKGDLVLDITSLKENLEDAKRMNKTVTLNIEPNYNKLIISRHKNHKKCTWMIIIFVFISFVLGFIIGNI